MQHIYIYTLTLIYTYVYSLVHKLHSYLASCFTLVTKCSFCKVFRNLLYVLIKVMMDLVLKKTQDPTELLFTLVNFESAGKHAAISQWDPFDKGHFYFWYFSEVLILTL